MLRNLTNLLETSHMARETGGIKTRQQSPKSVHQDLMPLFFAVVWGKNTMQIIIVLRACEQ